MYVAAFDVSGLPEDVVRLNEAQKDRNARGIEQTNSRRVMFREAIGRAMLACKDRDTQHRFTMIDMRTHQFQQKAIGAIADPKKSQYLGMLSATTHLQEELATAG